MRNRSGGAAKLIGYRAPDYEPKDTDVIALFRVTPQEGVDYRLSAEAGTVFMDYIRRRMQLAHFANARSIRNALERVRLRQANRLFFSRGAPLTRQQIMTIEPPDLMQSRIYREKESSSTP